MLAVAGVAGVEQVVEMVVYHYITMPSRVQHAMITSLHFSLPPVTFCGRKKRRKPDDRPFPEEDYKVFPRENLYDRIILPGKIYNFHNSAPASEGRYYIRLSWGGRNRRSHVLHCCMYLECVLEVTAIILQLTQKQV